MQAVRDCTYHPTQYGACYWLHDATCTYDALFPQTPR